MNNESVQNPQTEKVSIDDIKEELNALKQLYAKLLRGHADFAVMVAQLSADKIDEALLYAEKLKALIPDNIQVQEYIGSLKQGVNTNQGNP